MNCEPTVAVVLPARDEAGDLRGALECILAQDLPRSEIQVIVATGGSRDDTAMVARRSLTDQGLADWRLVETGPGTTPVNLNLALAEVRAPVVCRVDARSRIPDHYLRRCLDLLHDDSISVVGGAQVAVARRCDPVLLGIARGLNNRWWMGGSRYRRGAPSGVADTVYLGAFRTDQLRRVNGWDETLGTNQDFDLNRRMSRFGRIWFDSALTVGYLPRESVGDLFRQYRRFGRWKVRYWRLKGESPERRQLAMLMLPPTVAVGSLAVIVWRPRLLPRLILAVGAMVVAMEVQGSRTPGGPPVAHLVGVATGAAVTCGWLVGAYEEWLRHMAEPPGVWASSDSAGSPT